MSENTDSAGNVIPSPVICPCGNQSTSGMCEHNNPMTRGSVNAVCESSELSALRTQLTAADEQIRELTNELTELYLASTKHVGTILTAREIIAAFRTSVAEKDKEIERLKVDVLAREKIVREGWWRNHGCGNSGYGDDGEMQCCMQDFKRAPFEELKLWVWATRIKNADKKISAHLELKARAEAADAKMRELQDKLDIEHEALLAMGESNSQWAERAKAAEAKNTELEARCAAQEKRRSSPPKTRRS